MREQKSYLKSGLTMLILIFLFATSAFSQDNDVVIKEIEDHRNKQEGEFRDKNESPLSPRDRRKFKHLNFYPIDLKYRVTAKFNKTEHPVFFKMKTTTDRLPDYVKYGEVRFMLNDQSLVLEVYQSQDIAKRPGYEDYLFIPFTDTTNGEETYEVGRYLEFRIPKSEEVILDFNKCYNPYCSYGTGRYSCPIPPEANQLPIPIPVGEKKWH